MDSGHAAKALIVLLGAQKLGTVDQATLFWPLVCERLTNCLRVIGNDHSQAIFATEWANRIAKKLGAADGPSFGSGSRSD